MAARRAYCRPDEDALARLGAVANPNFGGVPAYRLAGAGLMTGPEGSDTAPLSGFTGSLFRPRVFIFLGLGVALVGLITLRRRYAPHMRAVSRADHRRCATASSRPHARRGALFIGAC